MTTSTPRHSKEELARLAMEILRTRIEPLLLPQDKGKFVAIDVNTGEYEIDEDDYSAATRLQARLPDADQFLACAGYPTTYRAMGIR